MNCNRILLSVLFIIIIGTAISAFIFKCYNLPIRMEDIPDTEKIGIDFDYTWDYEETLYVKIVPDKIRAELTFYPFSEFSTWKQRLVSLNYIRLHNPNLTEKELAHLNRILNGLKEVKIVNLNHCNITEYTTEPFIDFTELKCASFKNSSVNDGMISNIQGSNLKALCLGKTGVDGSFLSKLSNRNSIEYLNLNDCHLEENKLESLKNCKKLKILEICHSEINYNGLKAIGKCNGLERLKVADNMINDRDLVNIANLKKLIYLDLSNTNITDKGIRYLKNMERLSNLKLCGTAVSNRSLKNLVLFKNLHWLDLRGTKITKIEIDKFSKNNPELTVFSD